MKSHGTSIFYHMSFAISGDETNNYRSVGGIFFILKGIL
ncbi:hypothetical protein [Klebsiella pneumoniae]|nr:hypothetical protein [Klebsiella pneumoniae]HCI4236793.1 hypothetical protein [Klebsiella pneumoniae]